MITFVGQFVIRLFHFDLFVSCLNAMIFSRFFFLQVSGVTKFTEMPAKTSYRMFVHTAFLQGKNVNAFNVGSDFFLNMLIELTQCEI